MVPVPCQRSPALILLSRTKMSGACSSFHASPGRANVSSGSRAHRCNDLLALRPRKAPGAAKGSVPGRLSIRHTQPVCVASPASMPCPRGEASPQLLDGIDTPTSSPPFATGPYSYSCSTAAPLLGAPESLQHWRYNRTGPATTTLGPVPLAVSQRQEVPVGEQLAARVDSFLEAVPSWQLVVGLVATSNVVCAVSRGAMSVSVFPMTSLFHWSGGFTGLVQSGFFAGFTLSSLAGGYLASRVKPEALLAVTVAGTSLFTALTPLAAQASPDNGDLLLLTRALTGGCEGLIYPSIQGLVSARVPAENKAQSLGLCYSGAELGNVLALASSPTLIEHFGWASNFHLYSTFGFLWLAAWQNLLANEAGTEAKPCPSPPAPEPVAVACEEAATVPAVSLKSLLGNKACRAAMASHATYQMGNLITLSWLPTFFCQEYGTSMCSSASLSVLPWLVSIAATNGAGLLADKVVASGALPLLQTRKVMQAVASGGPALCLLSLVAHCGHGDQTSFQAMTTFTAMVSLAQFKTGGYGPNFMELSPKNASILCGTSTSIASVFGTMGIMATGTILDKLHSWPLVFGTMAALHLWSLHLFLRDGEAGEQQF
mmetsp:Transcript_11488/g.32596  ORF Transcript_11488/g.32596 Transcript_11488/m.32596 type:complete len:601 (+) Transcript_11488:566-2368(+)